MTADQGARFAEPEPGSKPITNDTPCGCAECRPGPGIDYGTLRSRISDGLRAHDFETSSETINRLMTEAGIRPGQDRRPTRQIRQQRPRG